MTLNQFLATMISMNEIPLKRKLHLAYGPMTLRFDKEIADNLEALEKDGVDCPELVRCLLREKLPEVRRNLPEFLKKFQKSS